MTQYRAGQWQALLAPTAALVVSPETSAAQISALWDDLQQRVTLPAIADTLISGTSGSITDIPPFAAALVEGDRVRIAVRGALEVRVESGDGDDTVTGENVTIWNERTLTEVRRVTITADEEADAADPLPFLGGVVRASALIFEPDAAAAEVAPVVASAPEPAAVSDEPSVPEPGPRASEAPGNAERSLEGGVGIEGPETPESAPVADFIDSDSPVSDVTLIPGEEDEEEHGGVEVFDSLFADTIVHAPKAPAPGQGDHDGATISVDQVRALRNKPASADETPTAVMPTITAGQNGRIRLSTGQEVTLDRAVIIGRRPRSTRASGTDLPHLIAVESPQQDISRNHLEIRPEGDTVVVADLHTTNGSTLLRPGADPVRLHPGEQTLVLSNDVIDLGDGVTVTFEELS